MYEVSPQCQLQHNGYDCHNLPWLKSFWNFDIVDDFPLTVVMIGWIGLHPVESRNDFSVN